MFTHTPSNKFLVLSPTESGPDASSPSSSPSLSSTSSSTGTLPPNGFLYLGYDAPSTTPSSTRTSSPAAHTHAHQPLLQCLPLTGAEHVPEVTSSSPLLSGRDRAVPERFRTMPLVLNLAGL
ncbi:hypothetical protein PHISP_03240 [Aspergillus sp. HF37]|nr:hypothetical protein PHISP_03240 [Aspergillus sp. HF37]